jgi:nucleotide-binding universal stress UspA family protein
MSPEGMERTMVAEETLASQLIDELLDRIERLTGRDAGQVTVMVEDGAPDQTILQQAERLGADLIVAGATGHRRRLFGGVVEQVVKRAHASVMVARAGGESGRILLATDFSGQGEPAAQQAALEAVRRCGTITIVHSIELVAPELALGEPAAIPPIAFAAMPVEELRTATRKRLADTLSHLGVTGEVEVGEGPPDELIVKVATERKAELIVLGTSRLTGIDRILLGGVAVRVIRSAPCSVLVARPSAQPRRKTGAVEAPASAR